MFSFLATGNGLKMDADLNDSCIDLETYDVPRIIKLQALFRGTLVRRQMKSLRDVYLGIVDSIETNKHISVSWDRNWPSYPIFTKHKKQRKIEKSKDNEAERLQINGTDCKMYQRTTETSMADMECHAIRNMVSVEIQTNGECAGSKLVYPNTEDLESRMEQCEDKPYPERTQYNGESQDTFRQTDSEGLPHVIGDSRTEEPVKLLPEKVDSETVVKTVDSVDLVDSVSGHQEVDQSDTSSLTEVTSIWESQLDSKVKPEEVKNINSSSILEVRKNIAMELLWVQQAINSRKNYLRLKSQME